MDHHTQDDQPRDDLALGVAAVAELLAQPATSLDELATRLGAARDVLERAMCQPSIAPLIESDPSGALRAAPGATSATLPARERRALAPRRL